MEEIMIIYYPLQLFDELGLEYMPDTEIITGVDIDEDALAWEIKDNKHLEPGNNTDELIDGDFCFQYNIYWDCEKRNIVLDWLVVTYDEKIVEAHIKFRDFEKYLESYLHLDQEPITDRDG